MLQRITVFILCSRREPRYNNVSLNIFDRNDHILGEIRDPEKCSSRLTVNKDFFEQKL